MGEKVFWKHDILTVGEGNESVADSLWYTMPEKHALHTMFNFMHNDYQWNKPGDVKNVKSIKEPMNKYIEVFRKGGHLSLAFNNHDNPRMLNKLLANDMSKRYECATALSTLQMLWYGNAYIYQGDEFGMINGGYSKLDEFKDIGAINWAKEELAKNNGLSKEKIEEKLYWTSRDQSRSPIIWDNSNDHGFGSKNPWLGFSHNAQYSLENDIKSQKSIFKWMQKMISFRKENGELIQYGDLYPMYRDHEQLFAFFRQLGKRILKIFINFSSNSIELTNENCEGKIIINNYDSFNDKVLQPYQVIVLETKTRKSLIK